MAIPEQIPLSGNPGIDGGVRMGGWVAPSDYSDPNPTHGDILGKGGYQCHLTKADIDAIIVERRSWGMTTSESTTGKLYKLCNVVMGGVDNDIMNNSNWILVEGGEGGSNSKIEYGNIILSYDQRLYGDRTYPAINGKKANKDIVSRGVLNTTYLRCYIDIIEYAGGLTSEIYRHSGLHFTTESEMWDWVEANCQNDGTNYASDIVALFYDIVDPNITGVYNLNGGNTLYQILKGRGKEKRSLTNCFGDLLTENIHINPVFYEKFMNTVVNNVIPEVPYTYTDGDGWNKIIWFPVGYKKRYNLLNDEAVIVPLQTTSRRVVRDDGVIGYLDDFGIPSLTIFEVLHSQSGYLEYYLGSVDTFSFYTKNDVRSVNSSIVGGTIITDVVLYKLRYNDGTHSYYSIFVKPVGIDALYVNSVDPTKYELNIIVENKDKRPYLKVPTITSSTKEALQNKMRLSKPDWWQNICKVDKNIGSENTGDELRFIFRERTTNNISELSRSKVKIVKKNRDVPVMAMISVE